MSNIINDKEKAMIAIQNNAWAFVKNISDDLKSDREIIMAAVSSGPSVFLSFLADHHKKDREIVMAAVNSNDLALEYVSDDLKKDKDFLEFIDKLNTT